MSAPYPISFELFPPRTPEGAAKLPDVVCQLAESKPLYFSVTYGAGGSTQEGTYDTLLTVVRSCGIEAAPHLTCIGSTRAKIAELLDRYREAGVRRIVALRGDLPAAAVNPAAPGEFHYANELVTFIREQHGNHFKIEVAAYPEMHTQANGAQADFDNFRRKVEAGADAAITQFFYNVDSYIDFVERCQKAGITIPIVPGIMPILGYAHIVRLCAGCGAELPRWLKLRLEDLQDDKPGLMEFGIEYVSRLCETLMKNGAPGLHFYTINQAEPTLSLCASLSAAVTAVPQPVALH